jgi:hypothetical protein
MCPKKSWYCKEKVQYIKLIANACTMTRATVKFGVATINSSYKLEEIKAGELIGGLPPTEAPKN